MLGGSSYKGLSKPDFVTQADAVCKKYNGLVDAVGKTLPASPSEQQVIDAVKLKLVPLFRQQLAELRKLKPPKEDRATVKTMLDDLEQGISDVDKNTKQFVESSGETNATKKADADAKAYGLKVCGASTTSG